MRGSRGLDSNEYDAWLAENAGKSRTKREELKTRQHERKYANDGVRGYHFGIDTKPVYTEDLTHFKHELEIRGLMLRDDVKKNLRGPAPHEFTRRRNANKGREVYRSSRT